MRDTDYPINLTEQEREKLESIVSYGRHSAQKITRARIMLQADDGESDSAIAEALDCSRSTAWRTRKKFHERDRIEAIERKDPDRNYETKLDGRDEAYLIRLACSEPPDGRSRWSLRVLAEKFGLCSFVRRRRRDCVIAVESEETDQFGIGNPSLHSCYGG